MKSKTLAILIAPALLLGSAARGAEVVARMGDTQITQEEIATALQVLPPAERAALAENPAMLSQYVRSILVQRLVLREAEKQNWPDRPEVKEKMDKLRDGVVSETYLEAKARPENGYPGDAALETAYEANKAALRVPRQWELAQIFIAKGDQAEQKLAEVKKKLGAAGADFAVLAKTYSEEPASAAEGGKIGTLNEDLLQPEVRAKLVTAKKGQTTDPIEMADGWHIIRVLDIKEPYTPTLEQIRPQLAEGLRAEKTKTNAQEYVTKLLQDNPVAINELALSQTLEPASR